MTLDNGCAPKAALRTHGFLMHQHLALKGELFLLGRVNTVFRRDDGALRFPMLAEYALQRIDGVAAGTILRVNANTVWIVEPAKHANREHIMQQIRALDSDRATVVFVGKIPRDPRHQSKIDYETLRELVASQSR